MTDKTKNIRLWQEIALALSLKGAVLAVIWWVWFSSPEDRIIDAPKVASQILSQPPQKEHGHVTVSRTR